MAAAAFSCCSIERTRTDEEREEERAKDDDEIASADADFARPWQSPGEAREAPRRGAGAAEAQGPREDARERDAVIIVGEAAAIGKKKETDKKGKRDEKKRGKSGPWSGRQELVSLVIRKSFLCSALLLPTHRAPCWPPRRRAWPACSSRAAARSRGDAAARRRPLPPRRRRWPLSLLCHDDFESTIIINVVACSMSLPALPLRRRRPSPLMPLPRPRSRRRRR